MHTDEEVKAKACQKLDKLPKSEIDNLTEVSLEIEIPDADGRSCRYAVFFERAIGGEERDWTVRSIVRPDNLQSPQPKGDRIE